MNDTTPAREAVLTLSCRDHPGVVAAVAGFVADRGWTITESQQYGDPLTGQFFMRTRFSDPRGESLDLVRAREELQELAAAHDLVWQLHDPKVGTRVLIMVSKFAHCLNELLFRASIGDLNLDVVAVASNHPDLGRLADSYGVPFRHIPVTPDHKPAAEAELLELVRSENVELVVLARYMQILSDGLCRDLEGRAINIHHSMLPSFKGARPYHQAHARGVKLIGATAHYVTADLDEGPIIEQEYARVDHAMGPDELTARGRSTEARALARAVRWHTEHRVLLNGSRTVVLR